MGHYRANLRDIEFMLFEVLRRDQVLGAGRYAEVDTDTARSLLREVEHLATTTLADAFVVGRPHPAGLRPDHPQRHDAAGVRQGVPRLHSRVAGPTST